MRSTARTEVVPRGGRLRRRRLAAPTTGCRRTAGRRCLPDARLQPPAAARVTTRAASAYAAGSTRPPRDARLPLPLPAAPLMARCSRKLLTYVHDDARVIRFRQPRPPRPVLATALDVPAGHDLRLLNRAPDRDRPGQPDELRVRPRQRRGGASEISRTEQSEFPCDACRLVMDGAILPSK